eukprot:3354897-Karenia_brevis.AAC.1
MTKNCSRGSGVFATRRPSGRETPLPRALATLPRPLARTRDTNTERNRNRFPGLGDVLTTVHPPKPLI